jgi:hypothetical protein
VPEIGDQERRALLAQGRALPPEPGRFPIRPGSGQDVEDAAMDVPRIPESEQPAVRRHIVRWAVADGTTDRLPETWRVERRLA